MKDLQASIFSHYLPDDLGFGMVRKPLTPHELAAKLNQILRIISHNGAEVRELGAQGLCCLLNMANLKDGVVIPTILAFLEETRDRELAASIAIPLFIYAIGTVGREGPAPHARAMEVFRTLLLHHQVLPAFQDEREIRMVIDRLAYQPIDMIQRWLEISPDSPLANYLIAEYGPLSELTRMLELRDRILGGTALACDDDYYNPYGTLIMSRPEVILAQNRRCAELTPYAHSENVLATGRLLATSAPDERTRSIFRGIITLALGAPAAPVRLAGIRACGMIIEAGQDQEWVLGNLMEPVAHPSTATRLAVIEIMGNILQTSEECQAAEPRQWATATLDKLLSTENHPKCRLAITTLLVEVLKGNTTPPTQLQLMFLGALGGLLSGRWGNEVLATVMRSAGNAATSPTAAPLQRDWSIRTIHDALVNQHLSRELQLVAIEHAGRVAVLSDIALGLRREFQGIIDAIYHDQSRDPKVRAIAGLALARIATTEGLPPDEAGRALGAVMAMPPDPVLGKELLTSFQAAASVANTPLRRLIMDRTRHIHPLLPPALQGPALAVAASLAEGMKAPDENAWIAEMLNLGIHDPTGTCQAATISLANAIVRNRVIDPGIRNQAELHIIGLMTHLPPPVPRPEEDEDADADADEVQDDRQAVFQAAADIVRFSTNNQEIGRTVKNIQTAARSTDPQLRVYAVEAAGIVMADNSLPPGQREWAKQLIETAANKSPYDEVRIAALEAAKQCPTAPWVTALTSKALSKEEANSEVRAAAVETLTTVILSQSRLEEWQKNLIDRQPIREDQAVRHAVVRAAREIKNSDLDWDVRLWAEKLLQRCLQD